MTAGARRERPGELLLSLTIAVAIVVFRSLVPTLYERFDFNSDQAIVGLMAKHLSELEAFPLFFYGQNYMLGVQSWIAVPFFWAGGPSVAMLRLPLVAIGAGTAIAFMLVFIRHGMRPAVALVATLPIIATTPIVSAALLETLGASVEPFAYVVLLWWLRHRPYAFGAALCVTILHREFTMFAGVAIALIHWRDRSWSARGVGRAAASFVAVWLLIDLLKRTVNMYGLPGGAPESASLILQARQISMWLSVEGSPYLGRLSRLVTDGLPDLFGARRHLIGSYGPVSAIAAGSPVAGAAFAAAVILCAGRVAWRARSAAAGAVGDGRSPFTLYLALIGLQTVLAYGLNSGIAVEWPTIIRYVLFALLLPVALFGAFFHQEPSRRYRAAAIVAISVWAALALIDNARLLREYMSSPPRDRHRELADYLVEHRIKYGRAGYWDSYIVTFLSGERVILASTGKVRIRAYQARVDANAPNAVVLRREPCSGGKAVAGWCIDDPFSR